MSNSDRTREQLIEELGAMRQRVAELEEALREHRPAGTALEPVQQRLRLLFEYASDAYLLMDFEGKIIDGNNAARELTGYAKEEVVGKSIFQIGLVNPDDLPKVTANLTRIASGQPPGPTEYRLTRKDGTARVVEAKSFPVKAGDQTLALVNARDITERKRVEEALRRAHDEMELQVRERTTDLARANEELRREIGEHRRAEEALRESEERYRLVAENQTDVVWAMDMNLRHTYCSPSITRLRGVSLEEAMAEAPEDFLTPSSLKVALDALAEELATENMERKDLWRTRNLELEMTCKDGSTVWTDNTISPVRDREGRLVGIVGVSRDIAGRRKTEEELRASEERYRALAENANEIIVVAQDEVLKYSNPKAVEITGYSREEMATMAFTELIHPGDREMVMERYLRRLGGEEFVHIYPFRILDKAGRIRWVEINAVKITWEGRPATLNFLDDITDRKKAEDALKASEERYRLVVENANEAIAVAQDGVLKFSNPKAWELLGRSREELAITPWVSLVHPEDQEMMLERYEKRLRGEKLPLVYPFRVVDRSGNVKWVETNAVQITWEGRPATLNFMSDITARRKAEDDIAHHIRRTEALHAVAQTVSQTLDMEELLNSALQKVVKVMAADTGSIHTLDTLNKALTLKAQRDMSDEAVKRASVVELDEEDFQRLLQWKDPHAPPSQVPNEAAIRAISGAAAKEQAGSFAAVPLSVKGRLQGVLSVGMAADREFTVDDIDLLAAIGHEIGVGIENARLLERTRELSITDELTGLHNRRHFYEALDVEMSRTQRYGRPFSLVLIDLDGFKEYNDKFGHTTGDAVLKAFAATLRSALRKTDIAFRYGGDEFTVVQPATDADRARKIVERIRARWLQKLKTEKLDSKTPLGFSAGISQFPQDAGTADALVSLADAALYRSKREGGYRTTLSSDLVIA